MISLLESCLKIVFSEPISLGENSPPVPVIDSLLRKKLICTKVINEKAYFYLRTCPIKSASQTFNKFRATSKPEKKSIGKFRSPILKNVSNTLQVSKLQEKYNQLLVYSKINAGKDENLKELIGKWREKSRLLILELRDLIGQVVVQDISRSLSLLEVANSLRFDIKMIGEYDECNDEFY